MLRSKEMVFILFIFALSLGYLRAAFKLNEPDELLDPSFFPMVLGFFSTLFSFILLVRCVKKELEVKESNYKNMQPLMVMSCMFLYVILFFKLGYFISSFIFVLVTLIMFSSKNKFFSKALISLIIVSSVYLLFEKAFGVRLPTLWG